MRPCSILSRSIPALLVPCTLAAAQDLRLAELRGMLPPSADLVLAIEAVDLDGDGDLDAVLAASPGGVVYLGDGNGGFAAAPGAIPGPTGISALAALDVEGDGDQDLVFGETSLCYSGCTTQTRLFLNDGGGAFADATAQLPAQHDQVEALASGDVDGDGDLDLLLGQDLKCSPSFGICSDPQTRLFLNDGSGTFADATALVPVNLQSTEALGLADLDGDGDLDAVLGNSPGSGPTGVSGANVVWRGDGAGGFAEDPAALPATAGEYTRDLAPVDVDGDGDLDLATATFPAKRLYQNDGSGAFADASGQLPASTKSTFSIAHGDVDGDGDADLFLGNTGTYGTSGNELFLNAGSGVFADASAQLPLDADQTYDAVLADVDQDGDPDALHGSYKDHQTRLYLNDGAGLFADVSTPLPADSGFSLAVHGDVDGDRDADVLVLGLGPARLQQDRLLLNDGTGVLVEAQGKLPAGSVVESDGVLFDMDADGDLDAALAGLASVYTYAPGDRLLRNDGTGTFSDASVGLPAAASGGTSVAAGDVDGDGDQDLLFVQYLSYLGLRLLVNDGSGVFADASAGLPATENPQGAELADVDGDGDLDAVVLDDEDRVLFNAGSGLFLDDPDALPELSGATHELRFGDLDGDGDLDAVTDGWLDIAVLLNDGMGTFAVSGAPLPPLANHPADLELADFDGDGALDVYIANSSDVDTPSGFERQDRIYLGDGLGGFAEAAGALPLLQDATWDVGTADFDADGDADAFVAGPGQERLYLNLTRQLARRAVPRVGKPLVLDLHGPAGAPWLLFSAPGTAKIDLGAFGAFLLDPARASLAGVGLLDPAGHDAAEFAVPASPSLIGKTLFWQALLGPKLSNLESTTATGL